MVSSFRPAGDQPKAIAALSEGLGRGDRFQTLLGITGSGKSATVAWTVEQVQRPTLVLAPNKSLAAQLANEMREFFPDNRVEYFVSYYDYYQPEAYMPASDTYIEKDSSVNDEIDRLRHSATVVAAHPARHVMVVCLRVVQFTASARPRNTETQLLVHFQAAVRGIRPTVDLLRRLVDMQYERNDMPTWCRGKLPSARRHHRNPPRV